MPRRAREKSASNMYHVMMRGVNRQDIFEDNDDRRYYLNSLRKAKESIGFRIHAFCLMTNHVHLLIETCENPLEAIFRSLGTKYAEYYNHKYRRVGHLFQGRFRSEAVDSQLYYMTVLRYILQNPMKAGLESQPGTYRWSSYRAYERGGRASITDTKFAEETFGGRDALLAFVLQTNEDEVMDMEDQLVWRLDEDQARAVMERVAGCSTAVDFKKKPRAERRACASRMYLENLSMGQIAELTGMSKATVQRAVQELDPAVRKERESIYLREAGGMTEELWKADSEDEEIW